MAKASGKTVEQQLEDAKAELATCRRFLDKVQTFSDIVSERKSELEELREEEAKYSRKLKDVRDRIRECEDHIHSASDGMLAILEPGPVKFMPLFDKMEKASVQKHGPNSVKWRELPISTLRLSPTSTSLLYQAEVLFIGQLQDRIMNDPNEWWTKIEGLTPPIAAAISDKLHDWVAKGGAN